MLWVDLNEYRPDDRVARRSDASKNVHFKLFTRRNPKNGEKLIFDASYIRSSTAFNPNFLTRIIIHGWMNDHTSPVNRMIKKAYLNRNDFNIVS